VSRFTAQLLHRPPGGVVDVVRQLLAVQAQEVSAFPLAFRVRSNGLCAADVVAARERREIVRCWGPRGTLHLIAVDDLPWLYPLVAPSPAGSLRRLRQLDADPGLDAAGVLAGRGPVTKAELGALLGVEGQAIVHLAALGAAQGLVVLGPERAGKATYVHAGDWLGAPLPTSVSDRDGAMRTLVARYRAAHDPSEPADLAQWSGLPLTEIRRAWGAESTVEDEPVAGVTLLPAYDEYLLGWRSRVAGHRSTGGVIRSAVLADGRVVGTWRAGGAVEAFEPLSGAVQAGIDREVADIARFLGR
jgi:hypothetical protein